MPQPYFPSLDKCLAGRERLISWETAYQILSDPGKAVEEAALEAFLTEAETIKHLTTSLNPFAKPSQKSKADFETKTAPINVSQSTDGDYNLEELKKDALWLSEKLTVDELVALRIVVLEWQSRAEDSLRIAVTGSRATAIPNPSIALGDSFAASTNYLAATSLNLGKEENRRARQLEVYLDEQHYILQTSTYLVERFAIQAETTATGRTWLDDVSEKVTKGLCSMQNASEHDTFCASCIETIDRFIQGMDDTSKWPQCFQDNDSTKLLYATCTVRSIRTAMRLLLANLYLLHRPSSSNTVSSWFKLVGRIKFFQDLAPSAVAPETASLQCLVAVISLTILQLPEVMRRVHESAVPMLEGGVQYPHLADESYILNDTCIKDVNLALYHAAHDGASVASPAIYAWSIITSMIRDLAKMQQEMREQHRIDDGSDEGEPISRRRASRRDSKDDLSAFEKQLHILQDFDLEGEAREDPPSFFVRAAVDRMGVYTTIPQLCTMITAAYGSDVDQGVSVIARSALFDLIREGMPLVSYGAEVLDSVLNILTPDVPGRSTSLDHRLIHLLLSDEQVLRPAILGQALARYPFELSPMLRLLTALSSTPVKHMREASSVVAELETLQTLTVMVPEHFRSYVLEHEDENMNSMSLTNTLPLFATKQALSIYGTQYLGPKLLPMRGGETERNNVTAIPSGAAGIVVKESRPLVFRLEHSHSGLEYLGVLLSTLLPNSELFVAPMDTSLDRSTAAEIIALINALLSSCVNQPQGIEEAQFILGRLAFALQDEQDIITIITDILEVELLAHLDQTCQDGSLELLVASAEFFDKLTEVSPERVWSMLVRSSLLGLTGGSNALAAVVGGSEVVNGRFKFLAACVSMYSHLIDDAVTGLVRRKTRVPKTTNRFDSPLSHQDATSERTMITVLNAYQTVMIDVWQSLPDWRFSVPVEKFEIATSILRAYDHLLRSTYGLQVDDDGISALLVPAATALLDAFATESGAAIQPFLSAFSGVSTVSKERSSSHQRQSLVKHAIASAKFLTTLLRTAMMVDETQQEPSILASQLVKGMPAFASLLASDHSFKAPLYALLTEMVRALNTDEADPPSILEQLSTDTTKSFLTVMAQLDHPICDIDVESTMWNFLSAVMSSKQQWLALYLLTGAVPKDRLKEGKANCAGSKNRSLLTYALDELSNIATIEPERAIAMLKFVASAQNTWVWATKEARSHSEFLKNVLEWLNNLQVTGKAPNIAEEMILANEHMMAAYVCDILAVNLFASNEIGDKTLIKMLPSKLSFLKQHGVALNAYNRSLHRNLADNFVRKFPTCELIDFQRTEANPAQFGRKYFYDLDFADVVLGHEAAWHGASNGRYQGFSDEFARANVNLSLVDAQTKLLKSWRLLSTTLCDSVDQDATLQAELAKTAEKCLRANVEANLDQPGMDKIVKIRAEMAFIIVSKLVGIQASDATMKTLLASAWDLVRSSPVDYDVATSPDDLIYYRILLQTLYLAIQPHVYMAANLRSSARAPSATEETKLDFLDPAVAACLVQIMTKVVAPGFRALCGNLHNDIELAKPGDFALITALVQGILAVPGVSAVHQQLADVVSSTSIVRGGLSLYSWSDQLAEVMEQDPIYGEVAVTFLLSLSSIRLVAEQMALDGILVQLASANLSNYYRKQGGKGPFAEPKRMFVIWTEGILPLCLNLLDAVGPPIAADVSSFLNSFSQQLQRANTALENREPTRQNPYAGAITLGLVTEAHSLCLIALILASDTARGAAEGIDAADVPALEYEYQKVKEDAAGLMRQKTSLASRIVPMGEREERWVTAGAGMKGDNVLLLRVAKEVGGLLNCFGKEE